MSQQHSQAHPKKQLAIVACMDTRLDVNAIYGLQTGDAHLIRNAGGVITTDAIRSLVVSQLRLGTKEIWLLHHEDCGMSQLDSEAFLQELEDTFGLRPDWSPEAFGDATLDIVESYRRIMNDPFIKHKLVRGFIFDVHSNELLEVTGLDGSQPIQKQVVAKVHPVATRGVTPTHPIIDGLV